MRKGLFNLVGDEWLMYDCASSGARGVPPLLLLLVIGVLVTATAPCARTWRAVIPCLRSRKT